jgi:hypothetical protein
MQLSLAMATARGHELGEKCADKAERVTRTAWRARAFSWLVMWGMKNRDREPFTSEAFVDEYAEDPCYAQPHDERAWGPVVRRALVAGVLTFLDSKGRRKKGHGSRCARYIATGKRPTEVFGE